MLIAVLIIALAASAHAHVPRHRDFDHDSNMEERIVSGKEATPGQFPYMCSLQDVRDDSHICGCTLIGRNKILTSARCVSNYKYYDLKVVFGLHKRSNPGMTNAKEYRLGYMESHPDFIDKLSERWPNDIAVLFTTQSVDIDAVNIEIIDMATASDGLFIRVKCDVPGWGSMNSPSSPIQDILHYANYLTIPNEECGKRTRPEFITDGIICMAEEPYSTCDEDWGGPMVCDGKLVGITSWTYGSCLKDRPDAFTRVSYYVDWVDSIWWE